MTSAPRPEPDPRWGDLRRRTLSAAILAPAALVCVWIGGAVFAAVVAAGFALLITEWTRLCWHARVPWMFLGGAIWIALGAAALWWLRADPRVGLGNLLFLLLVVWASDIGAYLTGRLVGGPKLVPHISPGKTWAGTLGGIVAAVLVGCAAGWLSPTGEPVRAAVAAAVLCVIGQLGDLAESWAKRRCGVKDSGTLIPGHGGLLDRVDALLAVAPVGALLAVCVGRGVLLWG
jgi:phosphatidate cytidylyltransferase